MITLPSLPQFNATLKLGEVKIWQLDLSNTAPDTSLKAWLSPDEIARMDNFKLPHLASQFLLAHASLRFLLSRYCDVTPKELIFETNPYGKPHLLQPKSDIHFNLSHSGSHALIGISRQHPIGIDIEQKRSMPDHQSLVKRFFSPIEQQQWASIPRSMQLDAFFKGWTSKEAFIKAIGSGMHISLDSFSVDLLPGRPARLVAVDPVHGKLDDWILHDLDTENDLAATLASMTKPVHITFSILDMINLPSG